MQESDNGTFEDAFKRLSGALQKRWKPDEWRTVVSVYFEGLKYAELADVLSAIPILQQRNRWPKLGDWIAALPVRPQVSKERVMRTDEVQEYLRAKSLHYHDEPCRCLLCQDAGVTDLPLRYVPDFTADDDEEKAFAPLLNRVVTTGHWAHGRELLRWYAAKQVFAERVPRKHRRILALIPAAAEREPGEDG